MLSVFSSFFLLSLNMMSSADAACPDVGNDEGVTIVENLDIQDWLLVGHTVETTLYGTWENEELTKIAIQPFPISSNSCLVEIDNRLVPGFVFVVEEERYLAVGISASEHLELQPTVYRYSFENAGHSLTLTELALDDETTGYAGIEDLSKLILSKSELVSTNSGMVNFHRI